MHPTSPVVKYPSRSQLREELMKRRRVIRTLIRALERYERTCAIPLPGAPRKPAAPMPLAPMSITPIKVAPIPGPLNQRLAS